MTTRIRRAVAAAALTAASLTGTAALATPASAADTVRVSFGNLILSGGSEANSVRFASQGNLVEVLAPGADDEDAIGESVIHAEVDRQTDHARLEELRSELLRVIGEVSAAVDDWPLMRERALGLATELSEVPPKGLDPEEVEEARELLAEMDIAEPGLDVLARVGFETLGLQTYLTAGPKESRAWTIPRGATAPEAAGVIHTDFQKGFIKAEVVGFDDLVEAGSMQAAKARGKVRLEGKDYVMADGDVVEFRFNV